MTCWPTLAILTKVADDTNLFIQSENLNSFANIQNKWPPQQWLDNEINFVATN